MQWRSGAKGSRREAVSGFRFQVEGSVLVLSEKRRPMIIERTWPSHLKLYRLNPSKKIAKSLFSPLIFIFFDFCRLVHVLSGDREGALFVKKYMRNNVKT
jgi:hypothetical protein